MGVVPPMPGFNAFLAETCRAHGALFISDEVMTGFRATAEGGWGLDGAIEGWTPDLMTFGKVMGGGFPAAAFGGRADVMAHLAPEGSGLPGRHALGEPDRHDGRPRHACAWPHPRSTPASTRPRPTIRNAVSEALRAASVPHVVQQAGTMFSVFFREDPVRDFAEASQQNTAAFAAFFHSMLDQGVYLPPSAYESWFVSAAHDDRAISTVLDALPGSSRRRSESRRPLMSVETIVHLLRHGEVHNPEGVLYGRRDGFHLSELGHRMAQRIGEALGERDIVHIRTSPARARAGDGRAAGRGPRADAGHRPAA